MRSIWLFPIFFLIFLQVAESNKKNYSHVENTDARKGRHQKRIKLGKFKHFTKDNPPTETSNPHQSLKDATVNFVQFSSKLFENAGWGRILPNSTEAFVREVWTEEETGLGIGWPIKALNAIMTACQKALTILKSFWAFFLIPIVLILIVKFIYPQISPALPK